MNADLSKLAYTVAEAAAAVGLSTDVIREAIRRNDLPAKKSGVKIVIPASSLNFFISNLPDA